MYTLAMAKNDLKEGWIDGFTLVKKDQEWMLEVCQECAKPLTIKRVINAARGEIRMFKTVDAAIKTAEQIGFNVHALKFEKL